MRTVGTLAAMGALLILLQIIWSPVDGLPWPIHFAPLLLGLALLAVAALMGLATGPGAVRLAVVLGLVSGGLFAFAITIMTTVSTSINQNAAIAGTLVAMLAVLAGWWAARPQPVDWR